MALWRDLWMNEWMNIIANAHIHKSPRWYDEWCTASNTLTFMRHTRITQKSHFTHRPRIHAEKHRAHRPPPPPSTPPHHSPFPGRPRHHTNVLNATYIRIRSNIITSSFITIIVYAKEIVFFSVSLHRFATACVCIFELYYGILWSICWQCNFYLSILNRRKTATRTWWRCVALLLCLPKTYFCVYRNGECKCKTLCVFQLKML